MLLSVVTLAIYEYIFHPFRYLMVNKILDILEEPDDVHICMESSGTHQRSDEDLENFIGSTYDVNEVFDLLFLSYV